MNDEEPQSFKHPAAYQMLSTDDEREFLQAIDRFKREHHWPYPTCAEILQVLRSLRYRKVSASGPESGFV